MGEGSGEQGYGGIDESAICLDSWRAWGQPILSAGVYVLLTARGGGTDDAGALRPPARTSIAVAVARIGCLGAVQGI